MSHATKDLKTIQDNLIFYTRTGSHLYGMATPESDEDFKGVMIDPDPRAYLGFLRGFNKRTGGWADGADRTIHEFRQTCHLLCENSPNVLELLFIPRDSENVTVWSDEWNVLVDMREEIVSSKVKHTFGGYAWAQRKKYENSGSPKHMMHAVRLQRMAVEFLTTGVCDVIRPDAEELLAIRNGAWTAAKFTEYFDQMDLRLDALYQTTQLKKNPSRKLIERLCVEILRDKVF